MTVKLSIPTISLLGESAMLASWGNAVSQSLNSAIVSLTGTLRQSAISGIKELVPAYASLLVVFDPAQTSEREVEQWIRAALLSRSSAQVDPPPPTRHHRIPVQYGEESGPDLENLATEEKRKPGEIVKMHTQKPFNVAFLGFLPGFAYMGKLSRRTPVARLATPRVRVPAGSVGLAGYQTGIYPFESPGGWRIIGRTGVPIWNPELDQPALFAPGDTVQFVESQHEPGPPAYRSTLPLPSMGAFEVVHAGGISMVQDQGRVGSRHLGVGTNGVFDTFAASRANALVGNAPDAAVLEITMGGPELRVTRNVTIALDGADFQCRADSALIPVRLSWFARAGTTIRFATGSAASTRGMRAYMAVAGGFDVPSVLGSRSTSLLAGFGGYEGRILRAGDVLGIYEARDLPGLISGRYWLGQVRDISRKSIILRFVPYSGVQAVPPAALARFVTTPWLVTEQSDRMGLRLIAQDGAALPASGEELASFGVIPGTIQLPPSGQPVVLGPDCQTTGGYPILGAVIKADMPLLAQAARGAVVEFESVDIEDARSANRQAELELKQGRDLLKR